MLKFTDPHGCEVDTTLCWDLYESTPGVSWFPVKQYLSMIKYEYAHCKLQGTMLQEAGIGLRARVGDSPLNSCIKTVMGPYLFLVFSCACHNDLRRTAHM